MQPSWLISLAPGLLLVQHGFENADAENADAVKRLGFLWLFGSDAVLIDPLWCRDYWEGRVQRFITGLLTRLVVLVVTQAATAESWANLGDHLRQMFGIFPPVTECKGLWKFWRYSYRLPLLGAFVAMSLTSTAFPVRKHRGTLISCTAALTIGALFWHAHGGGITIAWRLPLVLTVIYRPNLEDRAAGRRRGLAAAQATGAGGVAADAGCFSGILTALFGKVFAAVEGCEATLGASASLTKRDSGRRKFCSEFTAEAGSSCQLRNLIRRFNRCRSELLRTSSPTATARIVNPRAVRPASGNPPAFQLAAVCSRTPIRDWSYWLPQKKTNSLDTLN